MRASAQACSEASKPYRVSVHPKSASLPAAMQDRCPTHKPQEPHQPKSTHGVLSHSIRVCWVVRGINLGRCAPDVRVRPVIDVKRLEFFGAGVHFGNGEK